MSGKKFNFSWPPGCRVPPKVVQACMTQESHFWLAHRQSADMDRFFMEEFVNGPNPLTPEEVDLMCDLRPDKYERYRGFGARAKAAKKK